VSTKKEKIEVGDLVVTAGHPGASLGLVLAEAIPNNPGLWRIYWVSSHNVSTQWGDWLVKLS